MAKFVFIVPPLTGHVNPTLSIGATLLERGHQVAWISLDQNLKNKLPEGGELLLIQYDQTDEEKRESENYLDIISKKVVYGIDSIKFLYEDVLIPLNRHCYNGIIPLLKNYQPDLVIGDHQLFAASIAARKLGLPYATTVTAPAAIKIMNELPKVHEWEEKQIIALQQELGVEENRALDCSDLLTLVLTSQYFFGEMELKSNFKFTGPVLTERRVSSEFDWEKFNSNQRKKILVSIGTTFDHEHKRAFFQKVIDAFKDENLTVVVVSDPLLFEERPENFMVYQQVPQLDLLPHLDGVVSHGGHNTVSETLSNGLPLVVIPIAYDQSHVAGRVVRTGAGERLNFNRFKAHHLKEAVQNILTNPEYKKAAEMVRQSFIEAGGSATAANLLENTISNSTMERPKSKFLFVVPPFFGHISPTLSVGASLIARGHEVKWFGITPLDNKHIPEGGSYFYPEQDLVPYQDEIARILKRQDDGPACSGPEVMKLALEETYAPFAKIMMPGLETLTQAWQPDVIVNDCITFGGALFAHKNSIPCVTTTPVPPDVMGDTENSAPKIFEWQQNLIKQLQKEVGIEDEGIFIHSHHLNLIFTSQKFADFDEVPSHMKFVGPVKGRPNPAPFDWDKLNASTTPKIFVSLGTLLVDIRKAFFEKVIAAFADQPVTIIAATPPEIFEEWPSNFIVSSFVPQSALMPHMDAVICHGGFNTVNDTFTNGLPMLITPIAYDHFHIAKLIEKAGCGISIRYKRLRVDVLRQTVFELLENPAYRNAAKEVQSSLIDAGGNDRAVELLENFVKQSTLVPV
ncbi:glycosyltransferase [Chryseobacterium geocarposphaerae]|uniref:MGT family glycosyltransferase n=1 Tax=Chryseobacterium geocarposphaerae TaxID=1416776 RepID=A0A2M9C6Z2_9FLAO|nr:nucleotide disphospho-sugar-binding domain-containing protein [Chryseobacterium geocarposphaerae]PJJ66564.1 MGT family glycosyltransferase [Chryseobacterium geocarposphaerae]